MPKPARGDAARENSENSERYVHTDHQESQQTDASRPADRTRGMVFAFGGGKGGVGKTLLTAGFGIALAESGRQVVIVDADLGGSNLHMAMGIEIPRTTLYDFLSRRVRSLNEIVTETPIANLKFVSGSPGTVGMADPAYWEKQKLIRHIRNLEADYVLVDIGAGMSFNEVDLFLAADEGIIVANPEPPSIQEAFNFVKICLFRKLTRQFRADPDIGAILHSSQSDAGQRDTRLIEDILSEVGRIRPDAAESMRKAIAGFRPRLVLNMVYDESETIEGMALQVAAHDLLGLEIDNWGHVRYDPALEKAIRSMHPDRLLPADSPAARGIRDISARHFAGTRLPNRNPSIEHRRVSPKNGSQRHSGEEVICSYRCELWGNCSVQNGGYPCRIKYVAFARQNGGPRDQKTIAAA